MKRPACFGLAALTMASALAGCELADEQMAYVDQQRRDCVAAGGYYESNDIGSPDNYSCKGVRDDGMVTLAPPQPTECRTKTTTVQKKDGSVETRTRETCSSI